MTKLDYKDRKKKSSKEMTPTKTMYRMHTECTLLFLPRAERATKT